MKMSPFLQRIFSSRHVVLFLSVLCLGVLVPLALASKQLYTCGMHPQIIRDEPGDCPICGMKLEPVRTNAAVGQSAPAGERKIKYYKSTMIAGEVSDSPGKDSMGMDRVPVFDTGAAPSVTTIQVDAGTIQRMNLKTALVVRGPVRREIRTVGTVVYNEEGFHDISTKYEGWIETLLVKSTWTTVKAGDPLFEIHSPELFNAETNYLVARRSEGSDGGVLSRSARVRLELLDIPPDEIAALAQRSEAPHTRVFRAPVGGVVIEKMAVAGLMVKPGERLYRLADLSSVWVLAQIYEGDLPFVQEGLAATVHTTYGATRAFAGTVARLLPQVEDQTRAITARIVLPNADGFLRPGMFTDVTFFTQLAPNAVLVPETAVLRSGEKNTVFIARDGGTFEPREVTLGNRSEGGNYEVLSGLSGGERIVTSGQFMLDSESQLREAIEKMLKSSESPGPATQVQPLPSVSVAQSPVASATALRLYTCPMEEHADVVTDKPGKCPKCGMTLVPTTEVAHGKRAEALWFQLHPAAGAAAASATTPSISTPAKTVTSPPHSD